MSLPSASTRILADSPTSAISKSISQNTVSMAKMSLDINKQKNNATIAMSLSSPVSTNNTAVANSNSNMDQSNTTTVSSRVSAPALAETSVSQPISDTATTVTTTSSNTIMQVDDPSARSRITPLKKLTVLLIKTYRDVNQVPFIPCDFFTHGFYFYAILHHIIIPILAVSNMYSVCCNADKYKASIPFPYTFQRYYERKAQRVADAAKLAAVNAGTGDMSGGGRGGKQNQGWDDEHYDLLIQPNDLINDHYRVTSILGKGSFGQVVKVFEIWE